MTAVAPQNRGDIRFFKDAEAKQRNKRQTKRSLRLLPPNRLYLGQSPSGNGIAL